MAKLDFFDVAPSPRRWPGKGSRSIAQQGAKANPLRYDLQPGAGEREGVLSDLNHIGQT